MAVNPQAGHEKFEGAIAAPEKHVANFNVNLTGAGDSHLATQMNNNGSAHAVIDDKFGTPAITNGAETLVAHRDPGNLSQGADTRVAQQDPAETTQIAMREKKVRSTLANDTLVAANGGTSPEYAARTA